MTGSVVICWVRRDLRLADNPALRAAAATGAPVVALFIHDEVVEALGAAPKWRLGLGVAAFAAALQAAGSRLILRRGPALAVLRAVVAETGAHEVHWGRLYDPAAKARDVAVKAALTADGVAVTSHPGHLLHEPWTVETGAGGFYRVYTPYWNAVRGRQVPAALPAPVLVAPAVWPASDDLDGWHMGAAMQRGAAVVARHVRVGEAAAAARLADFVAGPVQDYLTARDFPALAATSGLSENLTYGEISPRTVWHAGWRAMQEGRAGAEHFLKELVWREFAYHLLHHTPEIASRNWKPAWDDFPWQGNSAQAEAWRRGRTGVALVDAAMRQMYVTGTMHNRARMVAASYLTKHLLTDWRIGQRWFEECLIDWDPAANAMGWQWVAGSGPDAAPYFRVFNPDGQAEKFDPSATYRQRFVAELSATPGPDALAYFDAVPRAWGLRPGDPYPAPVVALAEGRARALAAYGARGAGLGAISSDTGPADRGAAGSGRLQDEPLDPGAETGRT